MTYTDPTVHTSGITFPILHDDGPGGLLESLIAANGLTPRQAQLARAATRAQSGPWPAARQAILRYLEGNPVDQQQTLNDLYDAHVAFAALAQACADAGPLIAANAGTLTTVTTGIGLQRPHRSFPPYFA